MNNSKQKFFRIPPKRSLYVLLFNQGRIQGGARGNAPPKNCEEGGRGMGGGRDSKTFLSVEVKLKPLRTLRR